LTGASIPSMTLTAASITLVMGMDVGITNASSPNTKDVC